MNLGSLPKLASPIMQGHQVALLEHIETLRADLIRRLSITPDTELYMLKAEANVLKNLESSCLQYTSPQQQQKRS